MSFPKIARIGDDAEERVWLNSRRSISIDEAKRVINLLDRGYSQRRAADAIGMNHRLVSRLRELSDEIRLYDVPDIEQEFHEVWEEEIVKARTKKNDFLEDYLRIAARKYQNDFTDEIRKIIRENVGPISFMLFKYDVKKVKINFEDDTKLYDTVSLKDVRMVLTYSMFAGNSDFRTHYSKHSKQFFKAYAILHAYVYNKTIKDALDFVYEIEPKDEYKSEGITLPPTFEDLVYLARAEFILENTYLRFKEEYYDDLYTFIEFSNIEFEQMRPKSTVFGGYFPYTFKSDEYKRFNFVGLDSSSKNFDCFFETLNVFLKLDEDIIKTIRSKFQGMMILRKDVRQVLRDISTLTETNITITLYSIDGKFTEPRSIPSKTYKIINKDFEKSVRGTIALMMNHYFNCNVRGSVSFLAKCAKEPEKYLAPRDNVEFEPYDDSILTDNDIATSIAFGNAAKQLNEKETSTNYVFYDIESKVVKEVDGKIKGDFHQPFMICFVIRSVNTEEGDGLDSGVCYGKNCVTEFLGIISKLYGKVITYAHNAGNYDMEFFKQHMAMVSELPNHGIVKMVGAYGGKTIIFKDTYRMIPARLAAFPSMFGLEDEKEIYPYKFTKLGEQYVGSVPEAKYWNSEADREEYIRRFGEIFDEYEYTKYYCMRDVNIMLEGFMKFREEILREFEVDIFDHLTISSVANEIMERAHAYDDVPQVTGKIARFIRRSVVGGRVMVGANKTYVHPQYDEIIKAIDEGITEEEFLKRFDLDDAIVDFDAVSLYPSAISEMETPAGRPYIITDFNKVLVKDHMFFIECNVKVGKRRQFPLISEFVNGIRDFTNDLTQSVVIDYYTFWDLVEYHDADIKFIQGIAFPKRSKAHQQMIKKLFAMRLQKKKEGNPLQSVYKLLMNSAYGRTLLNYDKTSRIVYRAERELEQFVEENSELFKKSTEFESCGEKYHRIELYPYGLNYERIIIGTTVLSYSKHLMNRVMCLHDEIEKLIYYQDTDSIHVQQKFLPILSSLYRRKYNKELVGKELCQFHSDFDPGPQYRGVGNYEICSIRSIFIRKKTYADLLICVDKKTGKIVLKLHNRAKGVYSKAMSMEDYDYILKRPMVIDQCDYKPVFKRDRVGNILTLDSFKRTVS